MVTCLIMGAAIKLRRPGVKVFLVPGGIEAGKTAEVAG
jgi:hypothetical protein